MQRLSPDLQRGERVARSAKLPISPLVGEMSGRTEGGRCPAAWRPARIKPQAGSAGQNPPAGDTENTDRLRSPRLLRRAS
ncbi:MAG: hypothetical protein EOS18_19940 [Mesorhizobium sp.]|nr:MAG: hypothetical protein EOS18_19940 [Mesorhizobium sp.]